MSPRRRPVEWLDSLLCQLSRQGETPPKGLFRLEANCLRVPRWKRPCLVPLCSQEDEVSRMNATSILAYWSACSRNGVPHAADQVAASDIQSIVDASFRARRSMDPVRLFTRCCRLTWASLLPFPDHRGRSGFSLSTANTGLVWIADDPAQRDPACDDKSNRS